MPDDGIHLATAMVEKGEAGIGTGGFSVVFLDTGFPFPYTPPTKKKNLPKDNA